MTMRLQFADDQVEKPRFKQGPGVAYQALNKSRLNDAPFEEAEREMERLFDKNQTKQRLSEVFESEEFVAIYRERDLPAEVTLEFIQDLCIQMCIHKRAQPNVLIGLLWRHFEGDRTKGEAMQLCADCLTIAINNDFVDYYASRNQIVVRFNIKASIQQDLDRFQYPLPMVVQPKHVRNNSQNGYVSRETGRGLPILNAGSSTPFYKAADICLDHINRVNSIPLALNTQVAECIDNEWKDLDRRRPDEDEEQYQKRLKAFEHYDSTSKDVMHALKGVRDRFWLTHAYDRRGRVYCKGYHVNYQGTEWNKAVVELADKEMIEV